jgi:hypothetical protein
MFVIGAAVKIYMANALREIVSKQEKLTDSTAAC